MAGTLEVIRFGRDRGRAGPEVGERIGLHPLAADATEHRQAAKFGLALDVGGIDALFHDAAVGVLLGRSEVHVFIPQGGIAQGGADRSGIDHGKALGLR
jgi:hypothetical protein